MVLDSAGGCRYGAVCLRGRRSGDASLELAAPAAVRLAHAWLLASAGIAGAVPNPVRWTGRPRASPQSRMALPRSLPQHESGGAGKIPESDGRGIRIWRGGREGGAVGVASPLRALAS